MNSRFMQVKVGNKPLVWILGVCLVLPKSGGKARASDNEEMPSYGRDRKRYSEEKELHDIENVLKVQVAEIEWQLARCGYRDTVIRG